MFSEGIQTKNEEVFLSILKEKRVRLFIKREDEIHPFVSGNKYRKLKYNITEALKENYSQLLTFGGAFSNHIVATAVAGKLSGIKTIGIVRGEELANDLEKLFKENKTLREASNNGMQLEFIDRTTYREKESSSYIAQLKEKFGDFYLVPEGGTNSLAIKGCEEILTEVDEKFNYICAAIGTGGTISGLINSAFPNQKIIGFPALKGGFLSEEVQKMTLNKENWFLNTDYNFGGYAKYNQGLIRFMNEFKTKTNILLDPIYTGKMMFGILDLIEKDYFKEGTKILAIHTGGLQGIDGVNKKLRKRNLELIKK